MTPEPGQEWISGSGTRWLCVRRIGDAMPGEALHEWRVVKRTRGDNRTTGQFGDRYVRANWRRATEEP